MISVLVAEEQLTERRQVIEEAMSRHRSIPWDALDAASREAYGRYILFRDEETRRRANLAHLSVRDAFYNSYYWLLMFSRRYQSIHGQDAGIEQQVFKALESAPAGVDWKVVEELAKAVEKLKG